MNYPQRGELVRRNHVKLAKAKTKEGCEVKGGEIRPTGRRAMNIRGEGEG